MATSRARGLARWAKALRLRLAHVGDMTESAGLQQGTDDGRAERAGSAGDDHVTIAKIHEFSHNLHVSARPADRPSRKLQLYIDTSFDQRLDDATVPAARGGPNGPTDSDQRQVHPGAIEQVDRSPQSVDARSAGQHSRLRRSRHQCRRQGGARRAAGLVADGRRREGGAVARSGAADSRQAESDRDRDDAGNRASR